MSTVALQFCAQCGIRKDSRLDLYCSVCQAMLDAIQAQPGLVRASQDWTAENTRRIEAKARILGRQKEAEGQQ